VASLSIGNGSRRNNKESSAAAWFGFGPSSSRISISVGLSVTTCPPVSKPVPLLKFVSPLYTAEIACVPVVKVVDENCAVQVFPVAARQLIAAPRLLTPSLNCTVPVGEFVFGDGVTVAVNTTFCPMSEGLIEANTSVVVAAFEISNDCGTFAAEL